jgi:hypothetical protein
VSITLAPAAVNLGLAVTNTVLPTSRTAVVRLVWVAAALALDNSLARAVRARWTLVWALGQLTLG